MSSWLKTLSLATVLTSIQAVPQLSYPINEQLPPVARYGQEYFYQFAENTFTSDERIINYTISNNPDWLSIDSNSRSLSGTPSGTGSQTVSFVLTATDSTGSAQTTVGLLIVDSPAPEVNPADSLTQVLKKAGSISGENDLVLKPNRNFEIKFPSDFFVSEISLPISYSAVSTVGHAPLPIWLNFNPNTVQFTGTAPTVNSEIAPSQEFGVSLVAIEQPGYTGNQILFNLVVGARQFTTNVTQDVVNVTADNQFKYLVPLSDIYLDDQPVQLANISSISLNSTISWLHVDPSNGTISGTPPSSLNSTTQYYKVTVADTYNDTISYELVLQIGATNATPIFKSSSLDAVNATQGKYFQYSIKQFLVDKNANISFSVSPSESWINYHADNYTFTGIVPNSFKQADITVTGSDDNGHTERASFTVLGVPAKATSTSATGTSATATPTATSTPTTSSTHVATITHGLSSRTVAILCGVLIPCCVLAALILLFFCCRKRRSDKYENGSVHGKEISKPMPILAPDIEKGRLSPLPYPSRSVASSSATTTPGTAVDTPDDFKDAKDGFDWDSPHKVSEFNFLKMDSDSHYHETGDETLGSDGQLSPAVDSSYHGSGSSPDSRPPSSNISALDAAAAAGVPRPQNSWRQTDASDKRWQDHQSLGSLATISTDELLTMRLVDRDSYETSNLGTGSRGSAISRDTYMEPTSSMILSNSPRESIVPPLPSEFQHGGSPNIRPVGSHSSTLNSLGGRHSKDNSVSNSSDDFMERQGVEIPTTTGERTGSAKSNYTEDSFNAEHYRTASSGDDDFEELDPSEHEYDIRPYRNSRGQLTWSKVTTSDEGLESGDDATDNEADFNRANRDSRRDTARIVDFTKGRNANESHNGSSAGLKTGASAELAFL